MSRGLTGISGRRMLRGLAIASVALAGFFVGTAEVRASCGDYLMTSLDSRAGHHQDLAGVAHEQTGEPERPCHGPGCRSGNEFPATPGAPEISVKAPHWLCLLKLAAAADVPATRRATDASEKPPLLMGDTVFRPPRRAA